MTVTGQIAAPARPRVDPRLRQRWIAARREEGRRRLRLFLATLIVFSLLAAAFGVLHTPLLKVRHVRVAIAPAPTGSVPTGSVPTASGPSAGEINAAEIRARAGFDRERLMVNVVTGSEARLIESLPWVATVEVQRDWPGTIRIAVTTRRAVAEVDRVPGRPESGTALLDATGRVLALAPAGPAPAGSPSSSASGLQGSLPVLATLPAPGAPGTWIPRSGGTSGQATAEELATAAALPPALQRRISTITVTQNGLALRVGSVMVLFGDISDLTQKVSSLETVLAEARLAGVSVVDLRVPDRPALTPSPRTTSLSTTAGG